MDFSGFQAHYPTHGGAIFAMLEVNRARIVRRLAKEGWTNEGGKKHDAYTHPDFDYPAIVPRHKDLSPGVARAIARVAGWSSVAR
tara:strand:+ start:22969 stop:23223 length:255 start_codon:yes stop_codon:yes gene_type:complete